MTTSSPAPFTAEEREQLILDHLPQVKMIGYRIWERINRKADLDDLISAGVVGLISAIDRFEPARGYKLKTYADFRIKGEIIETLRHLDTMSRRDRRTSKLILETTATLQQQLGRTPDAEEVAAAAGLSLAQHQAAALAYANSRVVTFDVVPAPQGPQTLTDAITAARFQDPKPLPEDHAATAQLANALRSALQSLTPEEERLLMLHYEEGRSLLALTQELDTSEWTLRRKHEGILSRLRTELEAYRSSSLTQPLNVSVF